MRSGTKDLLTGLAGIVALAGLATLLLAYGELSGVVGNRWRLDVRLDEAGGLRTGSRVTLNGVTIGEVGEVRLAPGATSPTHPILAEARIDEGVRVPATAVAAVESSLLGGGASLALRIPLPFDPTTPDLPRTPTPVIEGRALGLAAVLEETLESRLAGLDAGIEDLRKMARTYTALGENLDSLVRPVDPASEDAEGSLRTTIARMNETLAQAGDAMESVSSWLDDEQLRQDVRNVVWRAGVMLEHTVEAVDGFASLTSSLEEDADEVVAILDQRTAEVLGAVVPVAEDSSELLQRLGELARLAADGDGTVGRLLRSPDLHDGLLESTRQLEATLRRAALLLEKIREEGLGVSLD